MVPSKAVMFRTLIFVELGVVKTSADSGDFSIMGALRGPPRLKSACGVLMGLTSWLYSMSRIIFLSSRFLSTNDWTLSDCLSLLFSRYFHASWVSDLDSPCSSNFSLIRLLRSFDLSLLLFLLPERGIFVSPLLDFLGVEASLLGSIRSLRFLIWFAMPAYTWCREAVLLALKMAREGTGEIMCQYVQISASQGLIVSLTRWIIYICTVHIGSLCRILLGSHGLLFELSIYNTSP